MLTIFRPNGKTLRIIPDIAFFSHRRAGELLEDHPEYNEQTSDWNFTVFHGTIRFCTGNPDKHAWMHILFHNDVNWLKKAWYLCYCEAHGYTYAYTLTKA